MMVCCDNMWFVATHHYNILGQLRTYAVTRHCRLPTTSCATFLIQIQCSKTLQASKVGHICTDAWIHHRDAHISSL
uniref:ATGR1 n=1 Tax=Arundo donax TaxID=35708 RepID=A0A0A9EA37_ARUDO